MRNRIRVLALSVVAIGGGVLASPPPASATYLPPPPLHCCCETDRYGCKNKCCSPNGCSVNAEGCRIFTT